MEVSKKLVSYPTKILEVGSTQYFLIPMALFKQKTFPFKAKQILLMAIDGKSIVIKKIREV